MGAGRGVVREPPFPPAHTRASGSGTSSAPRGSALGRRGPGAVPPGRLGARLQLQEVTPRTRTSGRRPESHRGLASCRGASRTRRGAGLGAPAEPGQPRLCPCLPRAEGGPAGPPRVAPFKRCLISYFLVNIFIYLFVVFDIRSAFLSSILQSPGLFLQDTEGGWAARLFPPDPLKTSPLCWVLFSYPFIQPFHFCLYPESLEIFKNTFLM